MGMSILMYGPKEYKQGGLTDSDDIANDRIAKRQVSCNGDEDVDECGQANACSNDACGAEMRIIVDLIQD